MPDATITAINVYPVKSCRGIATAAARVGVRGLAVGAGGHSLGDREWMIVDGAGRFVTQRDVPRLALVATASGGESLRLSTRDRAPIDVPLAGGGNAPCDVVVWNNVVRAHDAGNAAADWLSGVLGIDARLVRFDVSHERRCNPDYAGDSGAHISFADGYPVLVIGAASLDDLNARLAVRGSPALPMNRFRPNVVLKGLDPYDEDHLDTIEAGGVVLKLVKPCIRCPITTTDQQTAARGIEPLATLGTYRHDAKLEGVAFGMNAIVVAGAGRDLAVGMVARATFRF